jgi:hypothetical protein
MAASISLSTRKLRGPIAGNTARPASVILPRLSSLRTRALLSSVHGLLLLRGEKRCILFPSISFCTLSTQPKHSASSIASR